MEILDYGETEEGIPFLAMERLVGESLQQRLARTGPLSVPQMLGFAEQILDGLAQVHGQGVVHRDLKPSNIFVPEPPGPLKLLDFGLAKSSCAHTTAGMVIGTPAYMAPELLTGRVDASVRSDVYAVAVLLYEMLTGERPFAPDDDLRRFAVKVATQPAEDLRGRRPDVPVHVAEAIDRGLDKDPMRRPGSARALWEALAGAREPDPPTRLLSDDPAG